MLANLARNGSTVWSRHFLTSLGAAQLVDGLSDIRWSE
jgi:hypothetical protein